MKLLVTGGCGFLGSNAVADALERGDEVLVLDNLSRVGAEENLKWLQGKGLNNFKRTDVTATQEVDAAVRGFAPDGIFHLAGQVAMTTSLKDPRGDFETNVVGGMNVLEAVRRLAPKALVVYSSTNKVYGDLARVPFEEKATRYVSPGYAHGFDESLPLDFQSPYGCSKGAVDQYMLDYHRMFGVRTVVFRHSSIFGGRQYSTFDQGWIGWFAAQAVAAAAGKLKGPVDVAGDGKQVRDVLFASDIVACYRAALAAKPEALGQAFNIGGGMANSLSLIELFGKLGARLGVKLEMRHNAWRVGDQKVFVADTRKAERLLGWRPRVGVDEGLDRMLAWVKSLGR